MVIDEAIRQHHGPDLQSTVEHAGGCQILQHMGGEAADRTLLDRDQHFVFPRQAAHQVLIEGLGKAGVRDRG